MLVKNLRKWQKRNWVSDHSDKLDEYILHYYLELSAHIKEAPPIKIKTVPKLTCKAFSDKIRNGCWQEHHCGRYATTLANDDLIMKIQRVKHKGTLKELIKEIFISIFLSHQRLTPKIYNVGCTFNLNEIISFFRKDRNAMYLYFVMERVPNPFYQLFPIEYLEELAEKDKRKKFFNSRYWREFNLALKMYIGGIEKLLENNIYHNDAHDGNFGFDDKGKILFFDMGRCRVLLDANHETKTDLLHDELTYFKNMYFLDSKSVNIYSVYERSHLADVIEALEGDKYKFGSHISHLNKKLDIKFINN